MAKRHVAGLVRRYCEREAAQLRLHRIETVSLDIESDDADIARAFDEGAQTLEAAYSLVFGAVEFLLMRGIEPRRGQGMRRECAIRLALRPPGFAGRPPP